MVLVSAKHHFSAVWLRSRVVSAVINLTSVLLSSWSVVVV